jgi:hypothetical protein
MNRTERPDAHQKFEELAALAHGGMLNDGEVLELQSHLRLCPSCREVYKEFGLISSAGMSFLAAAQSAAEAETWNDRPVRDKILARIRKTDVPGPRESPARLARASRGLWPPTFAARAGALPLAAGLLMAVGLGAYRLGSSAQMARLNSAQVSGSPQRALVLQKIASDEVMSFQKTQLSQLENRLTGDAQEIAALHEALHTAEVHSAALQAASDASDDQLRKLGVERDRLVDKLHEAEQSYQLVQAELNSLRSERERNLLHVTSLESKIDELSAASRDQDRRLRDDEQYLASDRDIRELMGARKLYIADVFDVDSGSRTRKPFGRVFYTESKSLIFYAFDLDRQPGVKNASAFQVWGERDGEAGAKTRATNLGILYMDSESNRRWVLRLEDPKQLSEIDAVFVTVEPQGGSQKPTGKPFLYALLRREANHP